ncbi:MAG: hypothetical protein QXL16_00750 [Candidatus Micrarchaeaceae archaeon]
MEVKDRAIQALLISFMLASLVVVLSMNIRNFGAQAFPSSANALAQVSVSNAIYISISPNTINLGNVFPGVNYYTLSPVANIIDTDNGGNIAANIFISGTNWIGPGINSFGVSNTSWSSSNSLSPNMTLNSILTDTKIQIPAPTIKAPSQSKAIYFEISIPLKTFAGIYSQKVSFENENTSYLTNSIITNAVFSANVQQVCYISLSTNAINFGQVAVNSNTTYTSINVVDNNEGNTNANIMVYGTNWILSSNSLIAFGVSNTTWAAANVLYSSGTPLNSALTNTNIVVPLQSSNTIYFGLRVPGGVPYGKYSQNITIENSC